MSDDLSILWVGVSATVIGSCVTAGLTYLLDTARRRHENSKLVKELAIKLTELATKNGIDPMVKLRSDSDYARIYKTIETELNRV